MRPSKFIFGAALLSAACLSAPLTAQAQLFGDDKAREAILDLRQRFDQAVTAQNRLVDENAQLRRGMLDLQQQIEALRTELARTRGQEEQLAREVADLRKAQTTQQQQVDERMRKFESGELAGRAGTDSVLASGAMGGEAAATEKPEFDAALAQFRAGDFGGAQGSFAGFIKRYPRSSLAPSALFWLGNAQYATKNYKEAITNFRSLLTAAPNHARSPEAMLSIANCQVELKDNKAAKATLESLLKIYPQSEAAQAARERLAHLK